jgi:hypothetical protein
MDESGARVGCPAGEHVIVPIEVKELYTASPENRKSVTIIETIQADGREPPPPFIITPGQKIMDNWIRDELVGKERVACSPTGYTNNEIALEYLDHLIKHTRAGPTKPWKILLLDGHESHHTNDFKLMAAENHIKLFYFPSHLTHVLQPLDVGIFRPWKHYHNLAIQAALRSLDFEYTITSFFRDLTSIRQQTMKYHTIVNSFRDSGIWPPSAKAGLKKMRSYQKKKRTIDEVEQDDLELPALPPTRPPEIWNTAATVRALGDRDPTQFSEPSVQVFHITMKSVDIQLQKAHLTTIEHLALQEKVRNDGKRKITSRRSIHKGGPSATIDELREQKKARDEKEAREKLRKAKKKLSQAINRAKKDLTTQGIQARKDEKARLQRLKDYAEIDQMPDLTDLVRIREPDKEPTTYEKIKTTEEFYPELVQQIRELEAQVGRDQGQDQGDGDKDDVIIRLEASQQKEEVLDYMDSSPPPPNYVDSSDVESNAGSLDSIQRNADFVQF